MDSKQQPQSSLPALAAAGETTSTISYAASQPKQIQRLDQIVIPLQPVTYTETQQRLLANTRKLLLGGIVSGYPILGVENALSRVALDGVD